MVRVGRQVLVVLAIALSAAACSEKESGRIAVSTTTEPDRSRSTATTASPAVDPEAAVLEELLSDRVPPGFELTDFEVGDTGPSDLEKAIRDDGLPDAREILVRTGFVAGFQHLWVNENDAELVLFLYKFGSDQGAIDYRDRALKTLRAQVPPGNLQEFDTGVPNATAFRYEAEGEAGAVLLFTKGPYLVQIVSSGTPSDDLVGRIKPLAQDQYDQL